MSRPYRTSSKRIIQRGSRGRFRKTTMADIGMAVCEKCSQIFVPDFSSLEERTTIDPREFNLIRRFCPNCGGKGEGTNMYPTKEEK